MVYIFREIEKGLESFEITKISKQIVLVLEVILNESHITIERCIETLFDSVLSLSKEKIKAFMLDFLYPKVRELIRDLVDSDKLTPTPYRVPKHLIGK